MCRCLWWDEMCLHVYLEFSLSVSLQSCRETLHYIRSGMEQREMGKVELRGLLILLFEEKERWWWWCCCLVLCCYYYKVLPCLPRVVALYFVQLLFSLLKHIIFLPLCIHLWHFSTTCSLVSLYLRENNIMYSIQPFRDASSSTTLQSTDHHFLLLMKLMNLVGTYLYFPHGTMCQGELNFFCLKVVFFQRGNLFNMFIRVCTQTTHGMNSTDNDRQKRNF